MRISCKFISNQVKNQIIQIVGEYSSRIKLWSADYVGYFHICYLTISKKLLCGTIVGLSLQIILYYQYHVLVHWLKHDEQRRYHPTFHELFPWESECIWTFDAMFLAIKSEKFHWHLHFGCVNRTFRIMNWNYLI